MLEAILFGAGFAFAAAVQPGPLAAFLLTRVAERGWRATLPASLAPLVSDGPIALLVLFVLRALTETARRGLRAAGGLFLLYLAWSTWRALRRRAGGRTAEEPSAPRTLLQAATINVLNPNPYLGWSLVLGPATLEAWRQGPARAVALVGSFYGVLVASLAAMVLLFGAAGLLGERERRALLVLSAIALGAMGAYQLAGSVRS